MRPGDPLPQNNRATSFATVRGEPRILIVSADPEQDQPLAAALQSLHAWKSTSSASSDFPGTLAEMQSYDAIFISNLAAGDLGRDRQKLLESAVRDFGVGLVCVGGDQTYAAGGYRGTPLETDPAGEHGTGQQEGPAQRRGGAGHARHGVRQRQPGGPRLRPGRAGRARAPG